MSTYTFNLPQSAIPLQETNRKNASLIKTVVLVGVAAFVQGTGSGLNAHGLRNLEHQLYEPRLHIELPITNKLDVRSPAEHVAFIRELFALNMSELANILNVTRPTIYAWLEGQEPKPEMLNRIIQISQVADKLQSLDVSRLDVLVHRPIFDGLSFLDKLRINADTSSVLPILKKIADKEKHARNLIKGSSKNARSLSDAISDQSTPLYKES